MLVCNLTSPNVDFVNKSCQIIKPNSISIGFDSLLEHTIFIRIYAPQVMQFQKGGLLSGVKKLLNCPGPNGISIASIFVIVGELINFDVIFL